MSGESNRVLSATEAVALMTAQLAPNLSREKYRRIAMGVEAIRNDELRRIEQLRAGGNIEEADRARAEMRSADEKFSNCLIHHTCMMSIEDDAFINCGTTSEFRAVIVDKRGN